MRSFQWRHRHPQDHVRFLTPQIQIKQRLFICTPATVCCPWKCNHIPISFIPAPNQIGNRNKCKWGSPPPHPPTTNPPLYYDFSTACISIWIHEDGYCLWKNLWGFQHHILTAISGTICFMLADVTRLWTDLVLKCYNVLYILILFSCGSGGIHRTQPTGKKKNLLFKQMC